MTAPPPPGKPVALSLQHLKKRFGAITALRDLSLEVAPGSVYGLLGPNGAGKTTTLRMVMGILRADGGTILRNGAPLDRHSILRTGYLPEERGLYPHMTVAGQLAFFAALRGVPRHLVQGRVAQWLRLLDLTLLAQRRTDELSAGMQQLLQVSVALVHEPELVVFDEPFAGLDPLHVARVMKLLADLRAEGRAVLLSTHAMEQAEEICDRVAFLHHGAMAAEGQIGDVQRSLGYRVVKVTFRGPVPIMPILGVEATVSGTTLTLQWASPHDPFDFIRDISSVAEMETVEYRPASLREVFLKVVG